MTPEVESQGVRALRQEDDLHARLDQAERHIVFLERELAIAKLDCDNTELALRAERRKVKRLQDAEAERKGKTPIRAEIYAVFEEWQARCNHHRSKLGPKRFEAVEKMLRLGFTVADLKLAVLGASVIAFEKDGKVYDDLELICRNEVNVERFKAAGEEVQAGRDPRQRERAHAEARVAAASDPIDELILVLRQVQGISPPENVDRETGEELFDCPKCGGERDLATYIDYVRCRTCAAGPPDVIAALKQQRGQAT